MKLLTKAIRAKLERNYANGEHGDGSVDYKTVKPVLKLFNPYGAYTGIFTELEPDGDTLYGLADMGFRTPELGYSSLSEIADVKIPPFGLGIERDRYFTADKSLSEYAAEARNKGRITA